jgi:DamX protein
MFDKLLSRSARTPGSDIAELLSRSTRTPGSDIAETPQPFSGNNGEYYFAGDAARVQRLNLLAHLVPYGGVLLVLGESGVGKTALLQELQARASDSCRTCQLSANACIDPRQTLREMLDCFAWQADADRSLGGAQLRTLREHLGILRRNGYAPVLLIDDADALSDTVFGVLEQLFDGDSTDLLTLILAGESTLKKRLSSPLLQPLNAHITHEFEIQPFSAEEQTDYIREHLERAGIEGMGPFKASALKFIYVASRGVPQRINELAQVFWANKKGGGEAKPSSSSGLHPAWLRPLRYVLPLVLISAAAAIFHNEIRTAIFPSSPSERVVTAEDAGPVVAPPALPGIVADLKRESSLAKIATNSTSSSGGAERHQSVAAGASTPVRETGVMVAKVSPRPDGFTRPLASEPLQPVAPVTSAVDVVAPLSESQTEAVAGAGDDSNKGGQEVAVQSASNAAVVAMADVASGAREPARKQVLSGQQKPSGAGVEVNSTGGAQALTVAARQRRNDDWWMTQPAGQFAVQLLAMDEPVVNRYVERHALTDRVATFRVQRDDQDLLVVAMGPFATQVEANTAARHWQQQLPGVKPWVRSIASIQQAVTDYRRQQRPSWAALVAGHEQQLMKQSPQRYAVQLMAMDQKSVTAFVAKYGLVDQVVYFRTRAGGQDLYAALLGSFPSREQALAAGHEVARQAEGVRPWVRSLASVQQVIRDRRDRPR